jgi:hypothetical protein
VQEKNALFPIEPTLLGMTMPVNPTQFSNALLPITVTVFGIVTLVRYQQSKNAKLPMDVIGVSMLSNCTVLIEI